MEQLTEDVAINMQDLANEGARREIKRLRRQVKEQARIIRKIKMKLCSVRIETYEMAVMLECTDDEGATEARLVQTPKNFATKETLAMMVPQ